MTTDSHAQGGTPGGRGPGRRRQGRHAARPSGWARLLSLPVVLAVVGLAVAACLGPKVLAKGQAASSFSLPDINGSGQRISLSDYAGQPLIINFFASWSPPCTAETKLLAHYFRFYHGTVKIIGVDARDNRAAALALMRRSQVTYPVASDPDLVIAARYRVPGIPVTYFLNGRHQVVKADLGWLSWKKIRRGVKAMNRPGPVPSASAATAAGSADLNRGLTGPPSRVPRRTPTRTRLATGSVPGWPA